MSKNQEPAGEYIMLPKGDIESCSACELAHKKEMEARMVLTMLAVFCFASFLLWCAYISIIPLEESPALLNPPNEDIILTLYEVQEPHSGDDAWGCK